MWARKMFILRAHTIFVVSIPKLAAFENADSFDLEAEFGINYDLKAE